jgi:short-subunit dehydrogenase
VELRLGKLAGRAAANLAGTGADLVPRADRLVLGWPLEAALAPMFSRQLAGAAGGKRIVLTGASSGIGRDTALLLGDAGATVILVARRRAELEAVADEIRAGGGAAHVLPADLAEAEDADRLAREIVADQGGADILINNAGHSIRRSVDASYDRFHDFERTIQLNYYGALRLILALLPGMRERGEGHIVNVSTMGVNASTPRFSAYLASKAALDGFSKGLAPEALTDGVRITTVHMPLVRTPMIAPSRLYARMPALSAEQGARLVCGTLIDRPRRADVPLGRVTQAAYELAPKAFDRIMNAGYRLTRDSKASRGS